VLKLTLDTNCIIAIDEGRQPQADCLRSLIKKHDAGKVHLQLVATSASERQSSGPYLDNFDKFRDRLNSIGLSHLQLLLPLMVFDVSYLDWCVLADDQDLRMLEDIHNVLFPGQPYILQDALTLADATVDSDTVERKWRNRALDVHALWCHLRYNGDVFVTSDKNFHRKQTSLATFGPVQILDPCQADGLVR
jgi:hypothetical protein